MLLNLDVLDDETPLLSLKQPLSVSFVRLEYVHTEAASFSLHRAVRYGDTESVNKILSEPVHPDNDLSDMGSPLCIAAEAGYLDIVRLLCEAGAFIDTVNEVSETPLMKATQENHLNVMQYLIDAGAEMDKMCVGFCGSRSIPALTMAAECGHLAGVRLLCEKGANKDLRAKGLPVLTPLIAASQNDHLEIVDYLRDQGADTDDTPGDAEEQWGDEGTDCVVQ